MLRLIGLAVVVLLVLSLAHGERTGGGYAEADARADTLVDALTGRLADGVRTLGDLLFGPGPGLRLPPSRQMVPDLETAARNADARSRRALAGMVLRACPSLGLSCQPAAGRPDAADGGNDGGRPGSRDIR